MAGNVPLGVITVVTAGTPVRVTATKTPAYSYMVEPWIESPALTTAKGFVGNSAMNKTTGAGVFGWIPPATATAVPVFTATVSRRTSAFEMSDVWVDASVSGAQFLVSALEA